MARKVLNIKLDGGGDGQKQSDDANNLAWRPETRTQDNEKLFAEQTKNVFLNLLPLCFCFSFYSFELLL